MKIWIDSLTPKQLFFYKPLAEYFKSKGHKVYWTSRTYTETTPLIEGLELPVNEVGYWAATKQEKLMEHARRMRSLIPMIDRFKPDLAVSSCSPEMSRIAFGLGIKHYAYTDTPHSYFVMKMAMPLVDKLFIPWIFPKSDFTKHGISPDRIIKYHSLDPFLTNQRQSFSSPHLFNPKKKHIIIRPEETHASYHTIPSDRLVEKIVNKFHNEQIIILVRYMDQYKKMLKFRNSATITMMRHDGKFILENTDVFVGSGGTMTVESALMGVPTISMNTAPNDQEMWLLQNGLVVRPKNIDGIVNAIRHSLTKPKSECKTLADNIQSKWEDPHTHIKKITARGMKK